MTGHEAAPEDPAVLRIGVVVAGAAVVATVVAAVVRAVVDDWYPVGDNAFFAIRSQDVLTDHHPLLGTWTSASLNVGFDFNNPSPLLFDVLAIGAKLDPTLLPVGVAVLVLGCVAVMAWSASRVAGRRGVLVVCFASAALAWAMGPELLIDPWQPHSLLFPFLALLGVTAATWAGSDGSLAAVAALASIVAGTHLSYLALVGALAGSAMAAVVIRYVRHPDRRPHIARALALTGLVLVLAWSQPLIEQFTADDEGNISRLADVASADRGETVGLGLASEVSGTVVSPLPAWAPPSFEDAFRPAQYLPPTPPEFEDPTSPFWARVSLAAALALVGAVAVVAWRRGRWVVVALASVVAIACVGAVLSVAVLPVPNYGFPSHHVRWLWPASIAVSAVIAALFVTARAGIAAVVGLTTVMAVLAVVPTDSTVGPVGQAYAGPVLRSLATQLDDGFAERGPLVFDPDGVQVFEPFSIAVVMEMEGDGVEVAVDDPVLIRQLGPARAADGDERGRFFVWQGDLAEQGRPGLERIAFVASLTPEERVEMERRTRDLAAWFGAGELEVTDTGRIALEEGLTPDFERAIETEDDPFDAVGLYEVEQALSRGLLASSDHEDDLHRWAELRRRHLNETVGVWVDWDDD